MFGKAKWLDSEGNAFARMYHPVAELSSVMLEGNSGFLPADTECLKVEQIEKRLGYQSDGGVGHAGHAWVWGKSAVVKVVL